MEGPISFWGYKEQESNLILPEHHDDDDDDDDFEFRKNANYSFHLQNRRTSHERKRSAGGGVQYKFEQLKSCLQLNVSKYVTRHHTDTQSVYKGNTPFVVLQINKH